MSTTIVPSPSAPIAQAQSTVGTSTVMEQRPLGELARGSYVWPAWMVIVLVVGAIALVVAAQVRGRLKGKARK